MNARENGVWSWRGRRRVRSISCGGTCAPYDCREARSGLAIDLGLLGVRESKCQASRLQTTVSTVIIIRWSLFGPQRLAWALGLSPLLRDALLISIYAPHCLVTPLVTIKRGIGMIWIYSCPFLDVEELVLYGSVLELWLSCSLKP